VFVVFVSNKSLLISFHIPIALHMSQLTQLEDHAGYMHQTRLLAFSGAFLCHILDQYPRRCK